jgi:CheY-like chemotaxis protein
VTESPPLGQGTPIAEATGPGILVVDDDPVLRGLLNVALQCHGFAVWLAADAREALAVYGRRRDDIAVVLLDVQMPGIDGPNLLDSLRRVNPQVRCCFMSGDLGRYTDEELQRSGAAFVFTKPFRLTEMARFLRRLGGSAVVSGTA